MLVTPVRAIARPETRPAVTRNRPQTAWQAPAVDTLRLTVPKVSSRPAKELTPAGGRQVMTLPHRYQGEDASCGPSALWMVLGHHLGTQAVDFTTLDRSIRPTGRLNNRVGATPTALADAARAHGMAATVTNHADTAHLRRLIDRGLPAILLGTWRDGVAKDLHFIVVNGYEGTDDGRTTWHVTDSYVTGDGRAAYTTGQLLAFWQCDRVGAFRYPYQRAVVNVAPAGQAADLPADNRTPGLKVLDRALIVGTSVLRAFDNR
jgi:hypothetical protein